jgi:hypothetical protein
MSYDDDYVPKTAERVLYEATRREATRAQPKASLTASGRRKLEQAARAGKSRVILTPRDIGCSSEKGLQAAASKLSSGGFRVEVDRDEMDEPLGLVLKWK